MNKDEFKKLWTATGKEFLKTWEERYNTDTITFNSIIPEFATDGAVRFHLAYVNEPKEEDQTETVVVKEEKEQVEEKKDVEDLTVKEKRLKALEKAREVKNKKAKELTPKTNDKEDEWDDDDWED